MTCRKLSADASGAVLRKSFPKNTPEPMAEPGEPKADAGSRLIAYYILL
jgi:hypothetical protein